MQREKLTQNETTGKLKLPLRNCNTSFIFNAAMKKYVTSIVLKSRVSILVCRGASTLNTMPEAPASPQVTYYGESSPSSMSVFHLLHGLTCHTPALFHITMHGSTYFHNTGWHSFKFSSTVMLLFQS